MPIVYLNGQYLPLEDARIPVLDRGFMFGDGVYEVLLVCQKRILLLARHMARLENSLSAIHMKNPLGIDQWREILMRLVEKNPADDQSLYLQVTRGVSDRDHAIDIAKRPTIFAMSRPLPERDYSAGIGAITHEDIRWKLCHIKAITLLPSILLRHQALQAGAMEAILLKGGFVTEGAASNVFIVQSGAVITPPVDGSILPGITRDLVIELLTNDGIPCLQKAIARKELFSADEIWITSSTWEIVPVTRLDDLPVGEGKPGRLWKRAVENYQGYKAGVLAGQQ